VGEFYEAYYEWSENDGKVNLKNLIKYGIKEFIRVFASDIRVTHKIRNLGIFNFKALLNLGMLLVESERARLLRNLIKYGIKAFRKVGK